MRSAVLWVALLATSAAAETPAVVVLKAGRLIDGRGGAPMAPAMVRVEGDRIAEVGSRLAVPAGARVIDLGDATLLPGLIDLHTHLTDKFGVHWEQALVSTTPGQAALWGAANARATLMAGFTTCRDMGPTGPYVDVDLRNVIEQGGVPGPRLLVAGNYVSSTGGAGDARQFSPCCGRPAAVRIPPIAGPTTPPIRRPSARSTSSGARPSSSVARKERTDPPGISSRIAPSRGSSARRRSAPAPRACPTRTRATTPRSYAAGATAPASTQAKRATWTRAKLAARAAA